MRLLKQNTHQFEVQSLKPLSLLFKHAGWLSVFLWLIFIAPVQALELRVAIKKGVSEVKVGSSTPALVKDGAGKVLGTLAELVPQEARASGRGVTVGQWQSNQLIIEPNGDGVVWIGDRWYRGRTRLMRQGNGVTAINNVNLEEYLYSVVGAEAIPTWPQEALKAQAVAARSFAIYKSTAESNRFYDLDTTTATQVYKGLESEYVSTIDAVKATDGQVMTYNGKVILAAFHAASGGHTENVENVWSSPLPYLRGVVDYDQTSPVFQWSRQFRVSELSQLIGGIGSIRSMVPERTTPLGRIVTMRVVGSGGSKQLSGTQIRSALKLRSTLFTVSNSGGTFSINGRGSGHGIGLSQWGAYGLSVKNVTYDRILAHYYQNATLTQLNR
ncbi:MAG: SpoIID/LytB domain-containing protein [Snowella sp.]|nr:SpoIID/LytB domain-containing protein [Snowella sp.]